MITTVTLNPAIDRLYVIDDFQLHRLHRLGDHGQVSAGGKGVNIALGLERLGASVLAMGIAGGRSGRSLVEALHDLNLATNFVFAEGETRTNIFVVDPSNRTLTEISEPGPPLASDDEKLFMDAYERMIRQSTAIVLAGSLPPGCSPGVYHSLIGLARQRGLRSVLHCAPNVLEPNLAAGAFLICPDMRSTHQFLGRPVESVSDFLSVGRQLLAEHKSTELVLFLNRIENAVAISRESAVVCRPQVDRIVNKLGYADSFLAGLIHGLLHGRDVQGAVEFGSAAGLASAESLDKFFGGMQSVQSALPRVALEVIKP